MSFYISLALTLQSCRSGHFDDREINQEAKSLTIEIAESRVDSTPCSWVNDRGFECRNLYIALQVSNSGDTLLRHPFEVRWAHDQLRNSDQASTLHTNDLGRLILRTEVLFDPLEPTAELKTKLSLQSKIFGAGSWQLSIDLSQTEAPLRSIRSAASDFKPFTAIESLEFEITPHQVFTLSRDQKDPQSEVFHLKVELDVKRARTKTAFPSRRQFEVKFLGHFQTKTPIVLTTDGAGKLSFDVDIPYKPYENATTNLEFPVEVKLVGHPEIRSDSGVLILNFEQNPSEPLVGFNRLTEGARAHQTSMETSLSPQKIRVVDVRWTEVRENSGFKLLDDLSLAFQRKYRLQFRVEVLRNLIKGIEWKAVREFKIVGKLFGLKAASTENNPYRILDEHTFEQRTSEDGSVVLEFSMHLHPLDRLSPEKFLMAASLPGFILPTAFFFFDGNLQDEWSLETAQNNIGPQILDLQSSSAKINTSVTKSSAQEIVQSLFNVVSTEDLLPRLESQPDNPLPLPASFSDLRAAKPDDLVWKKIMNFLGQAEGEPLLNLEVFEVFKVTEMNTPPLLADAKEDVIQFQDAPNVDYLQETLFFKVNAKALPILVFKLKTKSGLRVFILESKEVYPVELLDRWRLVRPRANTSLSKERAIHGWEAIPSLAALEEKLNEKSQKIKGVIFNRLFPKR